MTIRELESQILALPLVEKARILQLLLRDFTNAWSGRDQTPDTTAKQVHKSEPVLTLSPEPLTDAEFEAIADQLADEWLAYVGTSVPSLSHDAVSRAGIYEEHP
jgi:hypothetical protein